MDNLDNEYKKIYSRKYRRAHYRNRWEENTDNHLAEEDFNNWFKKSRIVKRKHRIGLISDDEYLEYLKLWDEEDIAIKELIDKAISK